MNKRQIGIEGETKACAYLRDHGYRIVKKNFFCKAGEIDIIAYDGEYLCFIEVKFRADLSEGYPEEAVDERKIRRISKSALYYLNMCGLDETTPCRFDVISILGDGVTLIKNAFDAVYT
ncbi:MAG: YraN family protein [Lachnospiraceae bacterium]|nr:YraN family protein [Lachnospiraceae bacterium]